MVTKEENDAADRAIERWETGRKIAALKHEITIDERLSQASKDMLIDEISDCEKEFSPITVKPMFYLGWDKDNQQYFCGNFIVDKRTSIALKKCIESLDKQKDIKKYTNNKESIKLVNSRISELEKLIDRVISRIREDYDKFDQV